MTQPGTSYPPTTSYTLRKLGMDTSWLSSAYPNLLQYEWWGGPGGLVPVGVFMTLHAVRIAYEVRKGVEFTGRSTPLQELFCMLTFSFGGAVLTALMLGHPQPWLESNLMVPVYGGAYLLMTQLPGDGLYRLCRMTSPFSDVLLSAVDGLLRGYGITATGVDLLRLGMAGAPISRSLVGWITVGTILGCGGGIIDDVIQISRPQWTLRTPTMFRDPGPDFKLCLATTVSYIVTTRIWRFSEQLPNFPFSPLLDWLIDFAPHFSVEEARVIAGLACSAVLAARGYRSAVALHTRERLAEQAATAKKHDSDAGETVQKD